MGLLLPSSSPGDSEAPRAASGLCSQAQDVQSSPWSPPPALQASRADFKGTLNRKDAEA